MLEKSNQALMQMKLLRIETLYGTGVSLQKCCKMVGISVHTYYRWRHENSTAANEMKKVAEV